MSTKKRNIPLAYRLPKRKNFSSSDSESSSSSPSSSSSSSSSSSVSSNLSSSSSLLSSSSSQCKRRTKHKNVSPKGKDKPMFRRRPPQPRCQVEKKETEKPRKKSVSPRGRVSGLRKRRRRCSSTSCDSSASESPVGRRRRRFPAKKLVPCAKCNHTFMSSKGLVHHDIQIHSMGVTCTTCGKIFDTFDEFKGHALEHPENTVDCIYCKSKFGKPREMNEKRWEFVRSHLYGEILYARLAEYDDKARIL
ncbi:unnamed protein product [Caenorhabditis auriculariae]|uniref:C2H2-type domain-containing protein n=1 Tax=Caenorhabditis auriculariae TaxID=2777116 RepID=A0A8S1H416_9PELO|nr:unnamed protein product [Caenorhabditis auriculariae]